MLTVSGRHDNDRKLPRTPLEIYDLNRAVAAKMRKVFSDRNIPVVPSLGALPVYPHPGNQKNNTIVLLQVTMTFGVRPFFTSNFPFLDIS